MIQFIKLLCFVIMWLGVILIFDARNITHRFFSFGDQNEGTNGLKIVGFLIFIISGIICYCLKN